MQDHAPLLERAFSLDVVEQASVPVETTGSLPAFLRGTCYINGPARFSRGTLHYRHWLDGDGMVAALTFRPSGVTFTNRFVRSTKFLREEAEGRPVFRTFGTAFQGDELKRGVGLETAVKVSVYTFREALLAFGERLQLAAIPRAVRQRRRARRSRRPADRADRPRRQAHDRGNRI